MSAEETKLGAISSANYVLSNSKVADFWVGVEVDVRGRTLDGMTVCGHVFIVSRNGKDGIR